MMKQAVIDIGSNSMRLTLYEVQNEAFSTIFKEKFMAGLAGYVEDGALSAEGIECACEGLLSFRDILQTLGIENVSVFATASFRNISNTEQALSVIQAATGYAVEIISGEEEALLGYSGAMQEMQFDSGAFLDVGGASSEVVTFESGTPVKYISLPIGSLSLYRRCVKKIMPGEGSVKHLRQEIKRSFKKGSDKMGTCPILVCVGGTARAVLRLSRRYYKISEDCHSITARQLDELCTFLTDGGKDAVDLILRLEAERIHTLVPGMLIMQYTAHLFDSKQIIVSNYGAREGYLCQRVLKKDTDTPKIGN